MTEDQSAANYLRKMWEFIHSDPRKVANFMISGSESALEAQVDLHIFAGLFRFELFSDRTDMVVAGVGGRDGVEKADSKILGLSVPERVLKLGVEPAPPRVQEGMRLLCAIQGFPYAIIGFGETVGSEEPVAVLATVIGMTPEVVLAEFQSKARERLAKFN